MVTLEMAKEFTRDYLGTLKAKGLKNEYHDVKTIAQIMGMDFNTVCHFVVVAEHNKFMCKDAYETSNYCNFPRLFKVWESHMA